MKKLREIKVHYQSHLVGTLVEAPGQTLFQYERSFLATEIEISPLNMLRQSRPYIFRDPDFTFLPPIFDNSLPDSYGRGIMKKWFEKEKGAKFSPTGLDMLAYVGETGLGALTYLPGRVYPAAMLRAFDLRQQEKLARAGIAGTEAEMIEKLRRAAGSVGGSYPKALVAIEKATGDYYEDDPRIGAGFERWIVKFGRLARYRHNLLNDPRTEHAYHTMAGAAGITAAETRLAATEIEGEEVSHFFTRRFDVDGGRRIHMGTLSALLGVRADSISYRDFFGATHQLTGNIQEVREVYRRMAFNVLAANIDDHGKNHSFLLDGKTWRLAPAYDLGFSDEGGTHSQSPRVMSVAGESTFVKASDLLKEGVRAGLSTKDCRELLEQVREPVSRVRDFAIAAGVPRKEADHVAMKVDNVMRDVGSIPPARPRGGRIIL